MSAGRTVTPAAPPTARGLSRLRAGLTHIADILLLISLALWAAGVRRTHVTVLGPFGLLPDLPAIFYSGIAVLVVSAAAELAHRRPSRWRLGLHAATLVIMLYGTAPLLYPEARYTWLYKTVGVVQYVNANGQLNGSIDIYQNWPGFFALAAWFTKLAGLGSPLGYAKWAQLCYELAALPLLYLIYEQLGLTGRQRFTAIMLYSASNWIGQDYFSPQATGTLLSLGVMAMAMRWLYVARPARLPVWHRLRVQRGKRANEAPPAVPRLPRHALPVVCAVLLVYFVLTLTHELSPYILVVQLGALAAVRVLRPRWLPLALASIAIGYLLLHWSFVNSHYGLLNTAGDFFRNVSPPAFKVGASPSQLVIERCSEALSLGVWTLAAIGAWSRWRAGQSALPLLLLAYSPVVLLAVQGYGQEGILRVYLFSLPWAAALAACALLPWPGLIRKKDAYRAPGRRKAGAIPRTMSRRWAGAFCAGGGVLAALALFFPAFFGDDAINVISEPEVATITSFLAHASPGTIYVPLLHGPFADTARYNQFPIRVIFGPHGLLAGKSAGHAMASALARDAQTAAGARYVIVAPSMLAYSLAYHIAPARDYDLLRDSLSHSAHWHLVRDQAGTVIYELLPGGPAVSGKLRSGG